MYKQSTTRPVNIFYGHMALGVIFCFFITWVIGQYLAYRLGYQARLGQPMCVIKGYPVYYPLAWIGWYYHYYVYAKDIFHSALIMTEISYFIMFSLMLVLAVLRARRHRISGAYGTARWAETGELKKFGLLSDSGVVVGQSNDARYHDEIDKRDMVKWIMDRKGRHVLIHNGPEHVFCFAPTGSHKDVGLVIPTLLSWTDSALIYDIKEELWKATAGWRRKFSYCLRFAPTLVDNCVCFNPLNEIRKWPRDVKDAQEIADILVDPNMSKENKDHWEKTGHNFLVGAILHILYAEPDKSLTGLANFISNPQRPITDTLRFMMFFNHLGDRPHPVISSCAREMLNKSENELSGVVSTAMSFLGLYRDPIIADNTAYSDFAIEDLMNLDRPMSLYFVIPPSDIERARPLLRLILNQFGRRLTEKMEFENTIKESKVVELFKSIFFKDENKPRKHRLLMMMNEFASLGRLGFFESELSYLRAYGIKCVIICQSLNQLDIYGANNSILDNCSVRVTYGSLDDRTAKRISELLGQTTEIKNQMNFAGGRLSPWLGHVMNSMTENPRYLLTPGEVLQFPGDEAIIMIGGRSPYRAKKIMYFQDDRFMDRAWLPPPNSKDEQEREFIHAKIISPWETNVNAKTETVYRDDWEGFFDEIAHEQTPEDDDNGGIKITVSPDDAGEKKEKDIQIIDKDFENELFSFQGVQQRLFEDEELWATADEHIKASNERLQNRIRAVDIGEIPI